MALPVRKRYGAGRATTKNFPHFPAGNVRENRLAELLGGEAWTDLAARIPLPARNACSPDDSGDCDPASTTACGPKY